MLSTQKFIPNIKLPTLKLPTLSENELNEAPVGRNTIGKLYKYYGIASHEN